VKTTVITELNNPCNDPFIKAAAQEEALQQLGINVTVKVNGK